MLEPVLNYDDIGTEAWFRRREVDWRRGVFVGMIGHQYCAVHDGDPQITGYTEVSTTDPSGAIAPGKRVKITGSSDQWQVLMTTSHGAVVKNLSTNQTEHYYRNEINPAD